MELDKRILEGKRPLTCIDIEQAREFEGKQCLFSDSYVNYKNIKEYAKYPQYTGILHIEEDKQILRSKEDYIFRNLTDGYCYSLCLPLDWIKEPEKNYRALTLNEFLERFKIGKALYIRFKRDKAERVVVFTEYSTPPHKDEGNDTESVCLTRIEHHNSVVCLGMREYNLATLSNCYEYFDGKEWQPFGIEIEEK